MNLDRIHPSQGQHEARRSIVASRESQRRVLAPMVPGRTRGPAPRRGRRGARLRDFSVPPTQANALAPARPSQEVAENSGRFSNSAHAAKSEPGATLRPGGTSASCRFRSGWKIRVEPVNANALPRQILLRRLPGNVAARPLPRESTRPANRRFVRRVRYADHLRQITRIWSAQRTLRAIGGGSTSSSARPYSKTGAMPNGIPQAIYPVVHAGDVRATRIGTHRKVSVLLLSFGGDADSSCGSHPGRAAAPRMSTR